MLILATLQVQRQPEWYLYRLTAKGMCKANCVVRCYEVNEAATLKGMFSGLIGLVVHLCLPHEEVGQGGVVLRRQTF